MVGSEVKVARDEFLALINPNGSWVADALTDLFQGLHDIFAAVSLARVNRRRKAGERVHDGQYAQFAAGAELIMDKVHGPGLVMTCGFTAIFSKFGLHPVLGWFLPEL